MCSQPGSWNLFSLGIYKKRVANPYLRRVWRLGLNAVLTSVASYSSMCKRIGPKYNFHSVTQKVVNSIQCRWSSTILYPLCKRKETLGSYTQHWNKMTLNLCAQQFISTLLRKYSAVNILQVTSIWLFHHNKNSN